MRGPWTAHARHTDAWHNTVCEPNSGAVGVAFRPCSCTVVGLGASENNRKRTQTPASATKLMFLNLIIAFKDWQKKLCNCSRWHAQQKGIKTHLTPVLFTKILGCYIDKKSYTSQNNTKKRNYKVKMVILACERTFAPQKAIRSKFYYNMASFGR